MKIIFFEFLMFDKKEKKLYVFNNNDKLRVVDLMNYFDDKSYIKISDIYEKINFNELKKKYINKNDISSILNDIKSNNKRKYFY